MCSHIVGKCNTMPELTYITRYGSSFNAGNSTYGDTIADTANMINNNNSLSNLNVVFSGVSYSTIEYDPNVSNNSLDEEYNIGDESKIIILS